jgi:hypothetical protein
MSVTTTGGDELMKGKVNILFVVMLMVIASCMATRFSNVWVDEHYQKGPVSDVLVMAIFPSPERERMVEDEMAKQLRSRGVNTVLSYVEFPGKLPSEDEVMSELNKRGINAMLVTKFIKIQSGTDTANTTQSYAVIETSLYDVATHKKIWSALSETWVVGIDSRLTSSFVSSVLKELADDKLIR